MAYTRWNGKIYIAVALYCRCYNWRATGLQRPSRGAFHAHNAARCQERIEISSVPCHEVLFSFTGIEMKSM
jgi:hypothetical protein